MTSVQQTTVEELRQHLPRNTCLLSSRSVSKRVSDALGVEAIESISNIPSGIAMLIVAGGGALIDQAKHWRAENAPNVLLVAVPGLWGSSAEVSPIVVLNTDDGKKILMGPEYLPDQYIHWTGLAETLPYRLVRFACGDAWSHALEGFFSPLADDALRQEMANVIREMTALPLASDPHWFALSARACIGQAKSGVGLVHGIAHTVERHISIESDNEYFGHARLCSLLLFPVMALNRSLSDKWTRYFETHGIDADAVYQRLVDLYDADDYELVAPYIEQYWKEILHDPCSRINSAVVRRNHNVWFKERSFL